MKKNGYEESENGMSFSGQGRQEQALRIMEALSGVDEELLERADCSAGNPKRAAGTKKQHKLRRQFAGSWAAVLCLAVAGVLGWGGYLLTGRVDDAASGGNMNDMEMQLESVGPGTNGEGAVPEEKEAGLAEEGAAQSMDDQMSQENTCHSDMGNGTDGMNTADGVSGSPELSGNFGTSQRYSGEGEERAGEAVQGMGTEQGKASEEAAKENAVADSEACPAANQQKLTEEEARNQEMLGNYIPDKVPRGFSFESAFCNLDLKEENLTILWSRGLDTIMWTVMEAEGTPETVDIDRPETYDERLYEFPHGETVPQEYRQSVSNPTFAWEDFTQETVRSRMLSHADNGDTDTPRGNFSVLYPDNIVVKFNGRGTAEEIWEMFASLETAD